MCVDNKKTAIHLFFAVLMSVSAFNLAANESDSEEAPVTTCRAKSSMDGASPEIVIGSRTTASDTEGDEVTLVGSSDSRESLGASASIPVLADCTDEKTRVRLDLVEVRIHVQTFLAANPQTAEEIKDVMIAFQSHLAEVIWDEAMWVRVYRLLRMYGEENLITTYMLIDSPAAGMRGSSVGSRQ